MATGLRLIKLSVYHHRAFVVVVGSPQDRQVGYRLLSVQDASASLF